MSFALLMENWITSAAMSLIAIIPKVFYLLTMSILGVIDLFQMLVRKLAGLDCYYVDGEVREGDIVYQFITGIFTGEFSILSNVFWGMLILGIILLFLSTIIAIIRNEYTDLKDNSKGKIIGKAFKSMFYFAIIPIVCIFGVYLANIVLVAVDGATTYNTNYDVGDVQLDKTKLQAVEVSTQTLGTGTTTKTYVTYNLFGILVDGKPLGTTNTPFSGTIFKAAAYGANRVRATANVENEDENFAHLLKTEQATNFSGLFLDSTSDENMAVKIDMAFADNVFFAEDVQTTLDYESSECIKGYTSSTGDPFYLQKEEVQKTASRFNVTLVWYYYDLWKFNFVVAIAAGVILTTIFINIIFGLMRRLINLVALFISAAPLIALMPLDDEKAYKDWRGRFLKNTLMAYGAIGGMNLVMLILPELSKISLFNVGLLDGLIDTIFIIVALLAVKDFIGIVSGWAGGDDANKTGGDIAKDVGENLAKTGKIAGTALGAPIAVARAGGSVAKLAVKARPGTNLRATSAKKRSLYDQHAAEGAAEAQAIADQKMAALRDPYMNDSTNIYNARRDVRKQYAGLETADPDKFKAKVDERLEANFQSENKAEIDRINTDKVNNANKITKNKQDSVKVSNMELAKKYAGSDKFKSAISAPLSSLNLLKKEVGGIYTGNNFTKGWSGEDKNTTPDILYRTFKSTTAADVKKKKDAEKENAEKAKEREANMAALAKALKDSELEK